MLQDSQGRRLWIVDERGGHAPVFSSKDIQTQPRGGGEPDWWVVARPRDWTPPEPRSLLSLGAAAENSAEVSGGGTASETIIGAGGKPQPYGWHGRYTGPSGGSIPTGGGRVRLFAADEPMDGDDNEPGSEDSAAEDEAVEGEVLIAEEGDDSTPTVEQASYEEGGLSGGTEVRGPVAPPQKQPAEATWKNDNGSPVPTHEKLEPQTREAVEKLSKDNPQLGSINANSGKRDSAPDSKNAHVQGRAVDINEVNGARIKDVVGGNDPAAKERLRQQASEIEAWGKQNREVEMVITPYGGFYRYPGGDGRNMRPATSDEIAAHWNHIHIQTRK
ncbi:MAG: hypothetical protein RDU24_12615 [Humidesulfovibrio sp.]|uniref:hypothetical protein n=1 Tax=Humidesulfovibrio sp. TaxID=2910988 RepID=UPI0027F54D34|nr:hypothetical protein [Humidesulfovibrio sp.]MDQ7836218.1 hypothetical protein [Humidesulfovibrio sp.]